MQLTLLKGYPDRIGKRFAFVGYGSGPASYVTGGDTVTLGAFQNYIDWMGDATSISDTYFLRAIPSAVGPRATWEMKWFVISTGNEVANGVNLSAEQVQVGGFGGVY